MRKQKITPLFMILLLASFTVSLVSCRHKNYQKIKDGVILHLSADSAQPARLVELQVVTPRIIHVQASPADSFSHAKDLMIVRKKRQPAQWQLREEGDSLVLSTSRLHARVSLKTGRVSFADSSGHLILREAEKQSKRFVPVTVDSESFYTIRQVFQSPEDEAFYGLGEHQTGVMDLKGHDVVLVQYNTHAEVPFLVSNRNYGILWDNYSLTRFGYPKPYNELASLHLYGDDGREGGLTATYRSKSDPDQVYTVRKEDTLDYEFLPYLRRFPKEFTGQRMANGMVVWSGSVSSDFSGIHKFRLASAGYVKFWFNDSLLTSRWRQAWNPVTSRFRIPMVKGRKYPIKIQWIPDGGQSFISLKWRKPMPELDQHELSLHSQVGREINYYFVYGQNMDSLISGYRNLTGKAPIMPKWAMGFWQSREHYASQKQTLSVVHQFRERDIPIDNIVQDWFYWEKDKWGSQRFDSTRYPDPGKMIDELHNKYHVHYMISVWPKFYTKTPIFKKFWDKGWLYKQNVEDKQKDWVGYVSTFYDAFNPHARKAFWNLIDNRLFKLGVDAWWLDASEPDIYSNNTIRKRQELMNPTYLGPAAEYFNAYPLVNSEAIYKGQRRAAPNQRVFILTRSGFAGLQRYASAVWSGDTGTTWGDMKNQIAAGLNFSMAGIPFWTMDIGGFAAESRYVHPNKKDRKEWRELMTRWYQFGAFCPLFRAHGQFPYREVFNIAPENTPTYQSIVYYDKLRYRLMPYIYTLDGMVYFDNYTIMRGLAMDFPNDKNVLDIGDEYMFGPSLLINPVYTYKARSRTVYLPKSKGWYDLYSGSYYEGGRQIDADAPYTRMPVFVKAGSIIPFGPAIQYTGQKPQNPVTLFVYTGADAHFTLYNDEGTNYDYEKGQYSNIPISYDDDSHTLTIGDRQGTFPGMLENRTFRIVWVGKDRPVKLDFSRKPDAVVEYNGREKTIRMK